MITKPHEVGVLHLEVANVMLACLLFPELLHVNEVDLVALVFAVGID